MSTSRSLARGTPGFSGADLMNLVNESALMAARRNKRLVTMAEFEDAKDKIMMGAERRSSAMTQAEKELTAYHEAGHAIIALNVPSADPLHKATIIPRGRALGMVMQLPEGDRYSMSYKWMISRLIIMMGGRVAEEMKFGKENITSGASSDIDQATKLARAMVTRWGFSDKLGHVAYGDNQEEVFLGHSVARTQNVSEETAQIIDAEVRRLIDEAYSRRQAHPDEEEEGMDRLAQGLLEYETLSGDEIKQLIAGQKPSRDIGDDTPPSRGSAVPKAGAQGKSRPRRAARSPRAAWSRSRRAELSAIKKDRPAQAGRSLSLSGPQCHLRTIRSRARSMWASMSSRIRARARPSPVTR